ncbi:protein translocase subunit SecF [Lysobacter korlensis]|uniref:Protein-export membrane protein SecF n=1 Tax=Lysobacter korlensis TaxID=553636 RepID=A0ABV6RPP5_9GAMM
MKPFNVFPYGSKFNFMRLRWVSLAIALGLMLVSIGAMVFNGFNFAIDFTGGTAVELRFQKPADVDAVRQALERAGYSSPQVQTFGTNADLLIRLQPKATEGGQGIDTLAVVAEDVRALASTPDNPAEIARRETVGAQVGDELALNGIWALIFVVVGFLIYIWFRFEAKFAVAAVVTSMHDVVVVLGWFALTGHEFDLTVLAGVLSVLGFSINDTIVVFDRVRENFRGMRGEPAEILNISINQTLSRTVITSFVALLTVVALYLYGGGSLRGMAEAQMIGIVIGTVSTIFVACPLLLWMGVSKQDLMPKVRNEEELARRP